MDFLTTLKLAGLRPRDVVADGRIRRCSTDTHPGKRNGWYVLHADGHGAWGDWSSGAGGALGHWRDESATITAPRVDPAIAERRRQQEREARRVAVRAARGRWEAARPCTRLHPYLERKGLSALGTRGLRELDGMLMVPVVFRGRVVSFQSIHPDGTKRFAFGAPVKAGHFELARDRAALTVIVEGLATGLAVYQCVRNARVIVAFDAGNLQPVAAELRPCGSVVIAADNDAGTQAKRGFNPGIEKAQNAAELLGCGVVWPKGIDGTDYADALMQYGPAGSRRIEREILAGVKYVASAAMT